MGVNESPTDPTAVYPRSTSDASSILVSMKKDGSSRSSSPSPSIPSTPSQHQIPPVSSILLALRGENPPAFNLDSESSPSLSPIPKTSSILLSLKNDNSQSVLNSSTSSFYGSPSSPRSRTPSPTGTPYSTPPQSPTLSASPPASPTSSSQCFVPNCLVCAKGPPLSVLKTPTWSSIMRVVFYTLQRGFPEKMFFNLRTDVYVFMANHWDKLCPSKDSTHNWKKQIQDMLSHSKNMFESGTGFFKQNGYWRLKKPLLDPWAVGKSFHHRPHRSGKTRLSHYLNDDEPLAKRSRSDQDCQVPPLSENKSLVHAFRGLKTEMANMRERMQLILQGGGDRLSLSTSSSVYASSPPDSLWDSNKKGVQKDSWNINNRALFCNNVLPPLQSSVLPFSQPLRFRPAVN